MPQIQINKLVRDNIPQKYIYNGQRPTFRELGETEYLQALRRKLREERDEVFAALDTKDEIAIIEEIADFREVWMSLSKYLLDNDITLTSEHAQLKKEVDEVINQHKIQDIVIEAARLEKKDMKGGFDDRIYLEYVEFEG